MNQKSGQKACPILVCFKDRHWRAVGLQCADDLLKAGVATFCQVQLLQELRKAHQQNDRAVMQAYGFWGKLNTETECVAELMKMYQALTT